MLLLLSFLGHASLLAAFLNWRLEAAFLVTVSGYILLLFSAALAGVLHQASTALLYSGLPALAIACWLFRKPNSSRRQILIRPPLLLFFAYVVFAYAALSGRKLILWDEFTHWGLIIKVIAETSTLIGSSSAVLCQDYPPGAALFVYHCLKGLGYSEGHMIFAQSFLYFLPMLAFVQGLGWREWGELLLTLVAVYLATWTLSPGYGYLMVDGVLSLFFGAALAIYIGRERSAGGILAAAFILAAMVLLKKSGFFLAIVGGTLILSDQAIRGLRDKDVWYRVVATLTIFLLVVITNLSWQRYVTRNHLAQTFSQPVTTEVLRQSLSPKATEYQRQVRGNFLYSLLHWDLTSKFNMTSEPVRGPFSLPFWLAIIIALFAVCARAEGPAGRRSFFATVSVMLIGLCAYLFGLLILYMFRFPLHEGPYAASFGRYTDTYLLGFLLISLALMRTLLPSRPGWRTTRLAVLAILVSALLVLAPVRDSLSFWWFQPSSEIDRLRSEHAHDLDTIRRTTPPNSQIYMIYQHTTGLPYVLFSYDIAPRSNNRTNCCWSIRAPGGSPNPYECDWTPDRFASLLGAFDYLWVIRADPTFWATYGTLFADHGANAEGLYQVQKENGALRLRRVSS